MLLRLQAAIFDDKTIKTGPTIEGYHGTQKTAVGHGSRWQIIQAGGSTRVAKKRPPDPTGFELRVRGPNRIKFPLRQ